MTEGACTALCLWVIHTYALGATHISPILAIVSPEKRCGKTVLLDLLSRLVWRPLTAANITAASLFRSVEKWTPTLLIDEADTFLMDNEELRGVINSGHRRDTAKVVRTAGVDYDPRVFSTWAAKAIAQIGKPPATVEDRAIVVPMKRKSRREQVERFRPEKRAHELEILRQQVARWAADNIDFLRDADPHIPRELQDRAADNWHPLLAIADAAGGPWPDLARRHALLLSGSDRAEENSNGVQLLADLRDLFRERQTDFLPSYEIVPHLEQMEERAWGEWKNGKPISKNQIAALLRKYGILPDQVWCDGGAVRGYQLAHFQDAFSRYLPMESGGSVEANTDAGLDEVAGSGGTASPPDAENASEGPSIKDSTAPPDSKHQSGIEGGRVAPGREAAPYVSRNNSLFPEDSDYGEV